MSNSRKVSRSRQTQKGRCRKKVALWRNYRKLQMEEHPERSSKSSLDVDAGDATEKFSTTEKNVQGLSRGPNHCRVGGTVHSRLTTGVNGCWSLHVVLVQVQVLVQVRGSLVAPSSHETLEKFGKKKLVKKINELMTIKKKHHQSCEAATMCVNCVRTRVRTSTLTGTLNVHLYSPQPGKKTQ